VKPTELAFGRISDGGGERFPKDARLSVDAKRLERRAESKGR